MRTVKRCVWLLRGTWLIGRSSEPPNFKFIEAWGGESALLALQRRDEEKRQLCRKLGICLIEIDYTEPLTGSHIAHRLGLKDTP